jgi:hypothetical protein
VVFDVKVQMYFFKDWYSLFNLTPIFIFENLRKFISVNEYMYVAWQRLVANLYENEIFGSPLLNEYELKGIGNAEIAME